MAAHTATTTAVLGMVVERVSDPVAAAGQVDEAAFQAANQRHGAYQK
jgi:hypothetical protein